jgi:hypothetical protein
MRWYGSSYNHRINSVLQQNLGGTRGRLRTEFEDGEEQSFYYIEN